MNKHSSFRDFRLFRGRTRMSAPVALILLLSPFTLHAQSASLLGRPGDRPVLTLQDNSWCFQKVEPPKQLQVHDTVTVIVKENSQYTSEGEVDRRKRSNIDAVLQDWVRL